MFRTLFLFINFYLFFHGLCFSQGEKKLCYEINNPYIIEQYSNARELASSSPLSAYKILSKCVKIQPLFSAAFYLMGEIDYQRALNLQQSENPIGRPEFYFNRAVSHFREAIKTCPRTENYSAYYYLGEYYFEQKEYLISRQYLDTFLMNNTTDYESIKQAESFLERIDFYYDLLNNPVDFDPRIVLETSTEKDEYLPLLSPDGELLFFTRGYEKSEFGYRDKYVEEFSVSERIRKRNMTGMLFSEGEAMPSPFNKGFDQGGATITIDNRQLFITICEPLRMLNTSYKNCDIYHSTNNDGKWKNLSNLGKKINGAGTWEAQPSITPDGKILYFASAREGGLGGIDIYKSELDSSGNWQEPENLGPAINTALDDKTPFIHPDGKTLYFSSNGYFGLGGFDILFSQYLGNDEWTPPQNVGYPINTPKDDVAFNVTTNGEYMLFSSKELGKGNNWDIYSAALHEKARPDRVLFVKGGLYAENGEEVTNASVELQSVKSFKITKGLVSPNDGNYAVATSVKKNEDFVLTVKKKGNFFNSKYIKPSEKVLRNPPMNLNFKAKDLNVGAVVRLENIYFETNSAAFDSVSIITLNYFVGFLKMNPNLKIEIHGHTDNIGTVEDNLVLSQRRAKAVRDYLVGHGVASEMVTYKGFGESRPISSNATRKGRASNRRTEFLVISK